MSMYSPVSYEQVLDTVEYAPDKLQEQLFNFELATLAHHVQLKTKDQRSIPEIVNIIVDELLGGRWDYKYYLCKKMQNSKAILSSPVL